MLKPKNEELSIFDLAHEMDVLSNFTTGKLVELSDKYGVLRTPVFDSFIESMGKFMETFDLEALSEEDF